MGDLTVGGKPKPFNKLADGGPRGLTWRAISRMRLRRPAKSRTAVVRDNSLLISDRHRPFVRSQEKHEVQMRILPIIVAVFVAAAIYMFVFQRDMIVPGGGAEAEPAAVSDTETEQADDPDDTLVRVVVMRSVAQPLDSRVLVRGETQAAREVNLLAETSGTVISSPLRKGTFVKAGQAMCELDPGTRDTALAEAQARLAEARAQVPSAQARLQEARAQVPSAEARMAEARAQVPSAEARLQEARARLEEAQINENAASKLKQGGFASQTRVASASAVLEAALAGIKSAEAGIESALAGVRSAEAGMESAKANISTAEAGIESTQAAIESAEAGVASAAKEIERLTIHASFDGILESDTAELGSLLQPGGLCATVIQLDPIKLVGFVTELDVGRISVGSSATARLLNGTEINGSVSFVSRSADSTTRTFRAEVEVPNPDLTIRDGQSAEITISAEGTQAHLVPGSALTLNSSGQLGLRVLQADNVVVFKPVSVLRDTIDGMWVSGLNDAEDVIVVGQEFVEAGTTVAPTFREVTQ